jgi:hypothetical protein
MIFGAWDLLVALPAIEAELAHRFPRKPQVLRTTAARDALEDLEAAWVAYSQHDAAAAIFDVIRFCDECSLALPPEVSAEVLRLAWIGLSGFREASVPTPLLRHRDALVKLGRALYLDAVLIDAAYTRQIADIGWRQMGMKADPSADLPRASAHTSTAAAKIALERMPDVLRRSFRKKNSVGPQAVYTDRTEVRAAEIRPGAFYLPSEATAELLGWEELFAAFVAINHPPDAPVLSVV